MNNRLLVVATSGEVGEGARVFHAKVASHERGASGEGGTTSSNDPISFLSVETWGAKKTDHAGAKKGTGAFYGRKAEAKPPPTPGGKVYHQR